MEKEETKKHVDTERSGVKRVKGKKVDGKRVEEGEREKGNKRMREEGESSRGELGMAALPIGRQSRNHRLQSTLPISVFGYNLLV